MVWRNTIERSLRVRLKILIKPSISSGPVFSLPGKSRQDLQKIPYHSEFSTAAPKVHGLGFTSGEENIHIKRRVRVSETKVFKSDQKREIIHKAVNKYYE